jgi:hypothetical protein
MNETENKPKVKIQQETIIRLLREHAEMVRLLESFPTEIEGIHFWLQKKNNIMEKVTKKIVPS